MLSKFQRNNRKNQFLEIDSFCKQFKTVNPKVLDYSWTSPDAMLQYCSRLMNLCSTMNVKNSKKKLILEILHKNTNDFLKSVYHIYGNVGEMSSDWSKSQQKYFKQHLSTMLRVLDRFYFIPNSLLEKKKRLIDMIRIVYCYF